MSTPQSRESRKLEKVLRRFAERQKLGSRQWSGRLAPRRATTSTAYTPAHAAANRAIDEKQLGLGVAPGSGLARALISLPRRLRRLLLAAVQSTNPVRRKRLERQFQREAAARGFKPA